jgi:hypothetical protein
MIASDMLLWVAMLTIIGFLVHQFIALVRRDPDYWLFARNNEKYMEYWDFLERSQPEENTPLMKPIEDDEENKKWLDD